MGFGVPERLLRDLFPIDDELVAARYLEALAELGVSAPSLERFHIDAAGFSPEIAVALGDPHYLRSGTLHAHAIIVAAAQLRAALVHPSLGYAAEAFSEVTHRATQEITRITLREPILGEFRQPSTHIASSHQLADISHFELHFRTPGGLVRRVRQLEAMKQEFLSSAQCWLDDGFIRELAALAREVRDLGSLPDDFVSSKHGLELFYSPAFGGSYVLEEKGASGRSAITYILSVEPPDLDASERDEDHRSARGRRVSVERLDAASACAALERHGIARLDAKALADGVVVNEVRHWIAVDHLLGADPERPLAGHTPQEVMELMRAETDPPPEYLEIDYVARRVTAGRGRIDPGSLSPIARLRLLTATTSRTDVRRFVAHIRAFIDPLHLGRWWHDAPDVFFGRLHELSPARRHYFARWLEHG
jgi:hypothetical protein